MISPWCSGSGGIWILGISRFELRWPQMTSADLKAIRLLYSIWESHLPGVRSAVLAYLEIASLQARTPTWTAYFTCLTSASNQKSLMLLSLEDTLLIRSWSYLLFSFQDSFHAFARNEDGWSIPVPCPKLYQSNLKSTPERRHSKGNEQTSGKYDFLWNYSKREAYIGAS